MSIDVESLMKWSDLSDISVCRIYRDRMFRSDEYGRRCPAR